MSRDYKGFSAGHYYHVYNRGNNRSDIFKDKIDYLNFLKRLKILINHEDKGNLYLTPLPNEAFDIIAFCLMPNHFHISIRQNTELSISTLINRLCTSYVKYHNLKYGKVGGLFQDTFKAIVIDSDPYLAYLTAYIHNNPSDPFIYPYSSIKEYLTGRDNICRTEEILKMFNNSPEEYRKFVINAKPIVDKLSYGFER